MTTQTKHSPATPLPHQAQMMIDGRDRRIKDQTAELIRLQQDRRRLVEALRKTASRLCQLETGKEGGGAYALLRELGEE